MKMFLFLEQNRKILLFIFVFDSAIVTLKNHSADGVEFNKSIPMKLSKLQLTLSWQLHYFV